MPSTHVVLLNLTDAGRQDVEKNVDGINNEMRVALESAKGTLESFRWTSGPYDAVAIITVDDDLVPGFSLWLGTTLGATTTTLRAFDDGELQAGLQRWAESQANTGGLGP